MIHDLQLLWAAPSVLAVVMLALVFSVSNGWHDASNSVATVIGTRVLSPQKAVLWAALFNFIAAFVFNTAVANTVAKWILPQWVTLEVIAGGLLGAIFWNVFTWHRGLPSSSSHSLLGGLSGSAMMAAHSTSGVIKEDKAILVFLFIFIAPLIGLALSFIMAKLLKLIVPVTEDTRTMNIFKGAQMVSSALYSMGHGTGDGLKAAGCIACILYASIWKTQQAAFNAGRVNFPFWIIIVCHIAIALGTWFGGHRIIQTMAFEINKDELKPRDGALAETAAAISLFTASYFGIPVSSTHSSVGSLSGIGLEKGAAAVYWAKLSEISLGWLLTIPASAALSIAAYELLLFFEQWLVK